MIVFALASIAVTAVLGVALWFGARFVEVEVSGSLLAYCLVTNLVACWASFVPIVVVDRTRREYVPQAAFGATAIRMLLVGAATFGAMWYGPWATMPLSICMIVLYLGLLTIETTCAIRIVRRSASRSGGECSDV